MTTLDRRLTSLELGATGETERLVVFRRIFGEELVSVAASKHLPAADRLPGESERSFKDRLVAMGGHLPRHVLLRFVQRVQT